MSKKWTGQKRIKYDYLATAGIERRRIMLTIYVKIVIESWLIAWLDLSLSAFARPDSLRENQDYYYTEGLYWCHVAKLKANQGQKQSPGESASW